MKRHVAVLLLVLPLGIILTGCEPGQPVAKVPSGPLAPPPPPGSEPPPPAPAPAPVVAAPAPAPRPAPLPIESKAGIFAGSLDDLSAPDSVPVGTPAPAQPEDPSLERVKAGKGVGIKGRSLDEYEGIVVTPAKTLFAAKERIFFEIEFPANYDRWIILEDKVPQNFDELKTRFLDPLGLTAKMPELPPGHKYAWDAPTQQLMVERPKRKSE
ncbi:MAG: hypothetical protein WD872_06305 [Pirellulaceae bacterium]